MNSTILTPNQLLEKYAGRLLVTSMLEEYTKKHLHRLLIGLAFGTLARLKEADAELIRCGQMLSVSLAGIIRARVREDFEVLNVKQRTELLTLINQELAPHSWEACLRSAYVQIPRDFLVGGHSGPGFLIQDASGVSIHVLNKLSYGSFSVAAEAVEKKRLDWVILHLRPLFPRDRSDDPNLSK